MENVEQILHKMEELDMIRLVRITGNYYQVHCPNVEGHIGGDKHPSCGVLLQDEIRNGQSFKAGWCHCFSCGYSRMLPGVISDILKRKNINQSGLAWLKENIPGFEVDDTNFDYLIPKEISADIVNKYAVDYLNSLTQPKQTFISEKELASYRLTVPYMYERRLTDPVIEKYDVGFDANFRPEGSKNSIPCVTFPIKDIHGNVVTICRRSIKGKKFFMQKGIEKPVYGVYELPKNAKSICICESIFNALTCVTYGYNAVALLGTGTQSEIDQLQQLGAQEFILCLDNDDAGHRGIRKLKKALSGLAIVWTMTILPLVDPETGEVTNRDVNDLTKSEFDYYYSLKE